MAFLINLHLISTFICISSNFKEFKESLGNPSPQKGKVRHRKIGSLDDMYLANIFGSYNH